jgi:hypothetical protein
VMLRGIEGWPKLKQQEWANALHQYRMITGASTKRVCPQCKTRFLEPSKRLCETCREENRRETWKQTTTKRRMSDKSQFSGPDNQ